MTASPAERASGQAPQSIGEVFLRLARELELARQTGIRVEQSLCNTADARSLDGECVRDLQQFDLLLQHLGALRDFLRILAAQGGEQGLMLSAALARVTLHEVRARLSGELSTSDSDRIAGDVEMF